MRNKKGQFIHNKFTNWRIWVLSSTLLFCLTAANYGNQDRTYVADKPQVEAFLVPVIVTPPPTIEDKIKEYFPRSWPKMLAIAKEESGLDHSQKNWNCFYEGYWGKNKEGHYVGIVTNPQVLTKQTEGVISTWCRKKEDRKVAWSIDCGVLMQNYRGRTTCPEVSVDKHLSDMAELSKKCGLKCWSSYTNKTYLKHLASN